MITLKDLEDKKYSYNNLLAELHNKFDNSKVYCETLPNGDKRRPIFIIKNQSQLDILTGYTDKLTALDNEIELYAGKKARLKRPAVLQKVKMYRVWENTAYASTTVTTSRANIIKGLLSLIAVAEKYEDPANKAKITGYKNQLTFFEHEEEEIYRKRSIGNTVITSRVYFEDGNEQRVGITDGGVFLVGTVFKEPEGTFPDNVKEDRKQRKSLFNMIQSIPYSGGERSLLYRESDVLRAKEALKADDEKAKEKALRE